MRAAVRRLVGGVPRCEQFDDPVAGGRLEVAEVLAATISKVDLVIAAGIHLPLPLPSVAGREGVARLANGRRVLFYLDDVSGRFGSLAESCPIDGSAGFELPEGMDEPVALAIGATGLAAYIPLIRHGELRA
ncbi:MAG TPA: hypothetical protein VMD59_04625, partial [Acidimicrobiales bacterium]|nr:hypothetical protein [Acidimicrobiales bacterium]